MNISELIEGYEGIVKRLKVIRATNPDIKPLECSHDSYYGNLFSQVEIPVTWTGDIDRVGWNPKKVKSALAKEAEYVIVGPSSETPCQ